MLEELILGGLARAYFESLFHAGHLEATTYVFEGRSSSTSPSRTSSRGARRGCRRGTRRPRRCNDGRSCAIGPPDTELWGASARG